ncbi:MAG: ABC transporter ATP-binding protein [Patescibacteria group bacterium]|mgnify:CR=1
MVPLIKTENLKVIYNRGKDNEFTALNGVDIEIYPQEYIILFGPSGCGKSTFLYAILGLQAPSEGKIFIGGREMTVFTPEEKSQMQSDFYGIIFQSFNLIYSLNVMDNVALPQTFVNIPFKKRRESALELLRRFGLETRVKSMAGNLSGGQQQRVAICRALINNPKVLLADEPVGNLDSESADVVMLALQDINRKDKKTIILVTHDHRYLPFADRVYYFKDAKIERVVKNRKTGIQETERAKGEIETTNEFERVANVHSHMGMEQLKAWIFTEYLTEELTVFQRERFEDAMKRILAGAVSQHEFYEYLDRPYSEGGVGLYAPTALKYSLRVGRILKATRELQEIKKETGEKKREHALEILRKNLLDYDCAHGECKLNRPKVEQAMLDRVFGKINMRDLNTFFIKPPAEGGLGLHPSLASSLAERLEIILAQLM